VDVKFWALTELRLLTDIFVMQLAGELTRESECNKNGKRQEVGDALTAVESWTDIFFTTSR
jgi:hypothetical protein